MTLVYFKDLNFVLVLVFFKDDLVPEFVVLYLLGIFFHIKTFRPCILNRVWKFLRVLQDVAGV